MGVTPTSGAETPAYNPYTLSAIAAHILLRPMTYLKTLPCNRLPNNIHRTRVHTPLRCLQPHLHQVERVTDNDRTNTTGTTGSKGPDLGDGLVDRPGLSDLHIFLNFVCRGSRGGSHCDGDRKWGGGVGELYSEESEGEKKKGIEAGEEVKIKGE
jgi:hypothetical protein